MKVDDLISRQAAITLPVMPKEHREYQTYNLDDAYEQGWFDLQERIEKLPSAQPEIIFCKDCKKHNIAMGDHLDLGYNKYHWYEKSEVCPLIDMRGKAQGHEFDYQFCAYAERKTDD